MSHDDDGPILTPNCPVCSCPPVVAWPSLVPWFCNNDECDVLGWDPYSTLEENLMDASPVTIKVIERKFPESDA